MTPNGDPELRDAPPAGPALFQMIRGFWVSQAIYVAAKLGIADLVRRGLTTSAELAEAAGACPGELYRLLRFLASVGIFAQDRAGRFGLTPLSEYLATDVPGSLRAMAIMYGEEIYHAWGDLLHSVRTGETAFDHLYGRSHFEYLAQNPDADAVYSSAMAGFSQQETRSVISAYDWSPLRKVVDVGGGQGAFLAALLESSPDLEGVLLERDQVAAEASAEIAAAGLSARCEVIAGDFFGSVPQGGDAYLLKNILLNWDDEQCVAILRNCRRAMGERGRVLVIEAVIPPWDVPAFAKQLDLHMLVVTGGRGRVEPELRARFAAAGLELTKLIATPSPTCIVEGAPA